MPILSQTEKHIAKVYRLNTVNTMLYAYVCGVRDALHTVTIEQAVYMFMERYGLDDNTFNHSSGVATFARMQKELRPDKKQ